MTLRPPDRAARSVGFVLASLPPRSTRLANPTDRWADNVPGRYYVDLECILCSVCSDAAPRNFRMSSEEDHDICFAQPANAEEEAQCQDALVNCPVEAIGDDG